ncbi:MAG TPA: hypothetical protein VN642_00510 [Dongiaceae bacterium]|nr:hypothetical protein [Dongiaceae bacterium]
MSVDSITGNMTMIAQKPSAVAASADHSTKETSTVNDRITIQSSQPDAVYLNLKSAKKVSPANKPPSTTNSSSAISHVVVSYNHQGKIRTRFMDSRNNVVYQVPSELVAKMEDQMLKPETSTNIEG